MVELDESKPVASFMRLAEDGAKKAGDQD